MFYGGIIFIFLFSIINGGCGQHESSNYMYRATNNDHQGQKSTDPLGKMREAIASDSTTQVLELLKEGFPINSQFEDGRSALIESTLQTRVTLVDLFLKNNADINIKDNTGKTALDYAREKEISRVWTLLDLERQNQLKVQFLKFLNRGSADPLTKLLQDEGVNPNFLTDDGETPLTLAILKKKKVSIQIIAQWEDPYGITNTNINLPNKDNIKPLKLALQTNQPDIVELLQNLKAEE